MVSPKAEAAMRPCLAHFRLTEGFEDVGQEAGIHPPALVSNGDLRGVGGQLHADFDCLAFPRELHGVREQVADDRSRRTAVMSRCCLNPILCWM